MSDMKKWLEELWKSLPNDYERLHADCLIQGFAFMKCELSEMGELQVRAANIDEVFKDVEFLKEHLHPSLLP